MATADPVKVVVEACRLTLGFKRPYLFTEQDLSLRFAERGVTPPEGGRLVLRVAQDGTQSPANVWQKGDVEVYYEPMRGFLSSEGLNPEATAKVFEEISLVAEGLLGHPLGADLKWAELNAAARVQGSKAPLTALSAKGDGGWASGLGKILGESLRPFSRTFFAAGSSDLNLPLRDVPEWTHLAIEPFVVNPAFYFVRLVIRKIDGKPVAEAGSRFADLLREIVEFAENT